MHSVGRPDQCQKQHGPPIVDLLGIPYNFNEGLLMVTETRRAALTSEIVNIVSRGSLSPGARSKVTWEARVRGKPSVWTPWSPLSSRVIRTTAQPKWIARQALRMWLLLLHKNAAPRLLYGCPDPQPADILLFSDGFFPDPRLGFRMSGVHRG